MNTTTKTTTTSSSSSTVKTTYLIAAITIFALFSSNLSPTALYSSAVLFLVTAGLVVAARATMVTWITVLVLLAVAGKRRRVLAVEGKKITVEVGYYLMRIMVNDRGFVAVCCAVIVSLVAVVGFREEHDSVLFV